MAQYLPAEIADPPTMAQFCGGPAPSAEARLLAAVLMTTLADYRSRKLRPAIMQWVLGTSRAPWSFVWSCQMLGVDPRRTRAGMIRTFSQIRAGKGRRYLRTR